MAVAAGGQVLLSHTTHDLLPQPVPVPVTLRDLGEHHLKNLRMPVRLYQLLAPDLPHDFPPLTLRNILPNNLPAQLTPFVGRDHELTTLNELLRTARLVTLTGAGGIGKTRLSQEVGAAVLQTYPQGVWFVELAPLRDLDHLIPALAQLFGVQHQPFTPLAELVTNYLREKILLLILDNCEHLVAACAHMAEDLLHHCPGLTILASSREALGCLGEQVYRVPPLAPTAATHLFVTRARAANATFTETERTTAAIAHICRRLDALPLAIELAAARSTMLTPEQIETRLDDRFRLLSGGRRTAVPRQQTLRALIDWSYDLLTDAEQRLLHCAAVFVGGWSLAALEALADAPDALEVLDQLVSKSLVIAEPHDTGMRYAMLESIRHYAREKMAAQHLTAVQERHFGYFTARSETLWEAFTAGFTQIDAKADLDNFRAALAWGLGHQVEESVRLAANICATLLGMLSPSEGMALTRAAIERATALPPVTGALHRRRQQLLARAWFVRGLVGLSGGDMPSIIQAATEATALARASGDNHLLGYGLGLYCQASSFTHLPYPEAAAREALKIFTEDVTDRYGLSLAYNNMFQLASRQSNEAERQHYLGKFKALIREMPMSWYAGTFLLGMGIDARIRGHYETAKDLLTEGLTIFTAIGNATLRLVTTSELCHLERRMGNRKAARLRYQETLTGWHEVGARPAIANQFECLGFLAIEEADLQRAVRLLGAAEAMREQAQSPMREYERVEHDHYVTRLRAMLPDEEFQARWVEGRSLTAEQALGVALD